MPIKTQQELKDYFRRGLKPTERQFEEFIEAVVHRDSDAGLLGLKAYNPTRSYVIGDSCIHNNAVQLCHTATTGTFNAAHWSAVDVTAQVAASFPEWSDATTYADNVAIRVGARIFVSLAPSNLNQDPLDQPSAWWYELAPSQVGLIMDWGAGLWLKNQMVEHDGQLYRATTAPWFISIGTDFAAELVAGKWQAFLPPPSLPVPTVQGATLKASADLSAFEQADNWRNDGDAQGLNINEMIETASINLDDTEFLQVNVTAGKVIGYMPGGFPIPGRLFAAGGATLTLPDVPDNPTDSRVDAIVFDKTDGTLSVISGTEFLSTDPIVWPVMDLRTHLLLEAYVVHGTDTENGELEKLLYQYPVNAEFRTVISGFVRSTIDYPEISCHTKGQYFWAPGDLLRSFELRMTQLEDGSVGTYALKMMDHTGRTTNLTSAFTPTDALNTFSPQRCEYILPDGTQTRFGGMGVGTDDDSIDFHWAALTFDSATKQLRYKSLTPLDDNKPRGLHSSLGYDRAELDVDDPAVYDAGTSTLTLPVGDFHQVYYLTSTSLDPVSIGKIVLNAYVNHPIRFECQPELVATFVALGTAPGPFDAAKIMLNGGVDAVVDGDKVDALVLRPAPVGNGSTFIWKEEGRCIQ